MVFRPVLKAVTKSDSHIKCKVEKLLDCHILRRNLLLKHVTEEKIEEMGRPGRRRRQLLDDLMERRLTFRHHASHI